MLTPLRAIRAKCLDCVGGYAQEIGSCPCPDCPLYPFRLGKNPNMQQKRTPAQLEALKKGRIPFQSVDNLNDSAHATAAEGNYTPSTKRPVEVK